MDQACETPMTDMLRETAEDIRKGWLITMDSPNGYATTRLGSSVASEIATLIEKHLKEIES